MNTNKILGLAKNYLLKNTAVFPPYPLIFGKAWSSIIKEPSPIIINPDRICDHEIELGVIIGNKSKGALKHDYLDYIKGYFLCLDLTDRKYLQDCLKNGYPWFSAKSQDYYLPISKTIPKEAVKDPHNLDLSLLINGIEKQKGSTSEMHFKINDMIEFMSSYTTLNPGDMILTGTPPGIGQILPGDKLKGTLKENGKTLIEMKFDVLTQNTYKH